MVEASVEEGGVVDNLSIEEWLARAQGLVPKALGKARGVKGFTSRWTMIVIRLERVPFWLSDLSSHPCFSKNALCKEQLQGICETLSEASGLADLCSSDKHEGKLRMQNDLDALVGKLDVNFRDCRFLTKTGVLGDVTFSSAVTGGASSEAETTNLGSVKELLARLQIGHLDAKYHALESLVEAMKEDETNVLSVVGRSNVSALVKLLTATSPRIREKTVTIISSLVELGSYDEWLVAEGVLPPLLRLVESGGVIGKEKAAIALQRLSTSAETVRSLVGHGGVGPLIEMCQTGDAISQAAAACTLKNVSSLPEAGEALHEEGIVKVMIGLLEHGTLLACKEYAAECLQNLSSSGEEDLRVSVISGGGIGSLLAYLDMDGPLPQESAVGALRNLVGELSADMVMSSGILPRLVRVLKSGSLGAKLAAAGAVFRICTSVEMKRWVGESGCVPHLVKMLEAKLNDAREAAAQAISCLMVVSHNRKEVKKDGKSVPSLVALLDPIPHNTAKKYAVSCLEMLSSSRKCRKLMISYGAIGYLKKLTEMDVPGSKNLLRQLERGGLRSFLVAMK